MNGFCMLLAAFAVGVSHAADFTVSNPTILNAEQSAIVYDNVYLDADLTIDGADRGLTNKNSIVIGGSAAAPVTVTITNGASWYVKTRKTLTFSGKGGTIVVSAPTAPAHNWNWGNGGTRVDILGDGDKAYLGGLGTFGQYTDVQIDSNAEAEGGVLDIARLLTNGTISFARVQNSNPNVAARILFEGGTHWVLNDDYYRNRFNVGENARVILESVNGKPIYIRSLAQNYSLFSGKGVLETKGNGDFVLHHNYSNPDLGTITLSEDEGSIEWGHHGSTYLRGVATWKIGSDDVLPYGSETGPVIIDTTYTTADKPILLDLNGKSVKVNGLFKAGQYHAYSIVTNSSETVASLCLNVETNAVLSGLLNVYFAANASSNIRLQKSGAGTLTIDKKVGVAGIDVLEGGCWQRICVEPLLPKRDGDERRNHHGQSSVLYPDNAQRRLCGGRVRCRCRRRRRGAFQRLAERLDGAERNCAHRERRGVRYCGGAPLASDQVADWRSVR